MRRKLEQNSSPKTVPQCNLPQHRPSLTRNLKMANNYTTGLSHDVTSAILVPQNNKTSAMLVSQTSPVGVTLHAMDLFTDSAVILNLLDSWSIMGCPGGTRSAFTRAFRAKRELHRIFLGKKAIIITSKHGTTIFFSYYNLFLGKRKGKLARKARVHILSEYTPISRKDVGKSARDNPERYCGWF